MPRWSRSCDRKRKLRETIKSLFNNFRYWIFASFDTVEIALNSICRCRLVEVHIRLEMSEASAGEKEILHEEDFGISSNQKF